MHTHKMYAVLDREVLHTVKAVSTLLTSGLPMLTCSDVTQKCGSLQHSGSFIL